MPIYLLDESLAFPDPSESDPDTGILAVGGDLSPGRLILGYSLGIFPWYDESVTPILWHSPASRFVMRPEDLRIGRSIRKAVKRTHIRVRYNTAFAAVIGRCAQIPRPGQRTCLMPICRPYILNCTIKDTLIVPKLGLMMNSSGIVWCHARRRVFWRVDVFRRAGCIESCLYDLVPELGRMGYRLIDCRYTEYLSRFGATDWSEVSCAQASLRFDRVQNGPFQSKRMDPPATVHVQRSWLSVF